MIQTNLEYLIIEPPSEVNLNIPNLAAAYAATILKSRVIDLHALPIPSGRFLRNFFPIVLISSRSFNAATAAEIGKDYSRLYPTASVKSLSGIVDIQCCYPFETWQDNFEIDLPFGDSLPFPEYERFDSCNYMASNWKSGFWAYPIMTSLGCPFECSFCSARKRAWHPRSAHHAVEELKIAKRKWDIASFEVIDDVFNLREDRVIRFCELVKPLNLKWACVNGIRADRFSNLQAKAMAESGCVQVGFGIESVSDELLKAVSKGESFSQIEAAVKTAKSFFPNVAGFLMIGLPGSSYQTDLAALDWVEKNDINACFSFYVPPEIRKSGKIFFGQESQPCSPAYQPAQQMEVYRKARLINRGKYVARSLPMKVFDCTIRSIGNYSTRSWINHIRHLLRRGWSVLTTGDIQ